MHQDALELTIHTKSDIRSVTSTLRQAALDGVPAATIRITAPTLDGITLQVGGTLTAPLMDLVVVGDTVLRKSHVALRGRSISVSGLTFVGSPSTGDALQLTATDALTVDGVAFVGLKARTSPKHRRRGAKAGGRALALWAAGPQTRASVSGLVVADSTVQPAVSFGGKPGGRFDEITLFDAVLADTSTPTIHIESAVGVAVERVATDAPDDAVSTASPAIVVLGDPSSLTGVPAPLSAARTAALESP